MTLQIMIHNPMILTIPKGKYNRISNIIEINDTSDLQRMCLYTSNPTTKRCGKQNNNKTPRSVKGKQFNC